MLSRLFYLTNMVTILVESSLLNVNILTVGYFGNRDFVSLTYSAPAMDLAVDDVRQKFNITLNISLTYLQDPEIKDCDTFGERSDYLMSEWYYRQRDKGSLGVVVVPGTQNVFLSNNISVQKLKDVLLKNILSKFLKIVSRLTYFCCFWSQSY